MRCLVAQGLPNYYGSQRFGRNNDNPRRARLVLEKGQRAAGSKWKAKLLVSSLQSELFNHYLAQRIERGTFATVALGDVMSKVNSGGVFTCESTDAEQPRLDAFEISITGPIFGPKMIRPTADSKPAQWEQETLDALELSVESFARVARFAPGTRRPLRVPISQARVVAEGTGILLEFALPSGAYATVLASEIMKTATL
jgi:tRNA pseudouridine13 synthase